MYGFNKIGVRDSDSLESEDEPPSSQDEVYGKSLVLEDIPSADGSIGYLMNSDKEDDRRCVSFVEEDDDDISFTPAYTGGLFLTETNRGKPVYEPDSDYRLD